MSPPCCRPHALVLSLRLGAEGGTTDKVYYIMLSDPPPVPPCRGRCGGGYACPLCLPLALASWASPPPCGPRRPDAGFAAGATPPPCCPLPHCGLVGGGFAPSFAPARRLWRRRTQRQEKPWRAASPPASPRQRSGVLFLLARCVPRVISTNSLIFRRL